MTRTINSKIDRDRKRKNVEEVRYTSANVGHRRRGMNGGSVSILFTSSAAPTVLAILIHIRERHNYRSIQVSLVIREKKKLHFKAAFEGKLLTFARRINKSARRMEKIARKCVSSRRSYLLPF